MSGTTSFPKNIQTKEITAWDWTQNEKREIKNRKVHSLLSYEPFNSEGSDLNSKLNFQNPNKWFQSDNLTLKDLFDHFNKGYHIATGYREEWNLEQHHLGAGYTYFLSIIVEHWDEWGLESPASIQDYLRLLSESTINQIAWIGEAPGSTDDHKKFIIVFDFRVLMAGKIIHEAYHYLSQIPGADKSYTENVPRLIYGKVSDAQESLWIGGSISPDICENIIEKARASSNIQETLDRESVLEEQVNLQDRLDLNKTKISGLVNYESPIATETGKQTIIELAGKFHGKASRNWHLKELKVKEWVNLLNQGFHIAPGDFEYTAPNQSRRAGQAFKQTYLILLDVDEWAESNIEPPKSIEEWKQSLPSSIAQWITWVGESASSRSKEKPELRLRVAIAFELPIRTDQFISIAKYLHEHIPGTSLKVAKDKVRLSYGNARLESENKWYGGYLPYQVILDILKKARQEELENNRREAERRQYLFEERLRRKQQGLDQYDGLAPWEAFDIDLDSYLESKGYTSLDYTSAGGWKSYSRPDGTKGKPSLGIRKANSGAWRVSSLSTSIPWPGTEGTLSFLEFYCWQEYQLDITGGLLGENTTNFKKAMQLLSKDGYGNWEKGFNKNYQSAVKKVELSLPIDPDKYPIDKLEDLDNLSDKDKKELSEIPPYWNLDGNNLKHHYIINRDYYTQPKGNPEVLEIAGNYKLAWLDGPPGVAKTTFQLAHARKLATDEMKVVAGPRKILAANLASYLNDELRYDQEPDQNVALKMPVKYIHGDVKLSDNWPLPIAMVTCTIHSMLRTLNFLRKKNITKIHLALDEIDFIIQALYSPQLRGKAQDILNAIKELAEENTVYLTGATISPGLVQEFTRTLGFTEEDVCQISINREAQKGGTLLFAKVQMTDIIDTLANAIEKLPKKHKIFIGFADKEGVKTLSNHPKIQKRGKVQVVTSENSQQEEIKKLMTESTLDDMDIDVLIASPSIDVGINLFGEDTQVIIVRASTFGAPVKTSWQQARRVRNTKLPVWYFSAEVDWTQSLTLEERKVREKHKVIDNFLYFISCSRNIEGKEDKSLFAEFHTAQKKILKTLEHFIRQATEQDILDSEHLNLTEKEFFMAGVARSLLKARLEWEVEQELLFEEFFIEYHAKREGMEFRKWVPEKPTEEQVKNTKKASSIRKKEEKTTHDNSVLLQLTGNEYSSLEAIEIKRKEGKYENNEYEVALEVNKRIQTAGAPNVLLDDGDIRELEAERAIGMIQHKIDPNDFQRKYEIYEAFHYPDLADARFNRKNRKDIVSAVCRPIQVKLLDYLNQNLSFMGSEYTEVFYREIFFLMKQKIILINEKGIQVERQISDAIFLHFPETLPAYKRMRRYGTSEQKAFYTIISKVFKQYLHKEFTICGEKSKKRQIQDIANIDIYYQYFEEVSQAEEYYQQQLTDTINDRSKPDYPAIEIIESEEQEQEQEDLSLEEQILDYMEV